jgi:hypothetical protein
VVEEQKLFLMKQMTLPFVVGLLATFACRTVPGQDVRYEPTPMPVVRPMLKLANVGGQDVYDLGSGRVLPAIARKG